MSIHKDSRIGIIGGGPAGLSSALYLQRKGYKNITLLEKNESVGGKSLTVNVENSLGISRTYELGAEFITYSYDHIWDLCKLLNERTIEAAVIRIIKKEGASGPRFIDPLKIAPWYKVIPAAIKYLLIGFFNRKLINSPSNVNIAKRKILSMKLIKFIDKYNLSSLEPFFLMKQFGYGTFETIPVVFMYRTLQPRLMMRILGYSLPIIKSLYKRPVAAMAVDGTQGLYKKLAAYLELKQQDHQSTPLINRNQHVNKISRKDGQIRVYTNDGIEYEFDKLIVAIPPGILLKLMEEELSEKEIELFSKFSYHPYYVGAFRTENNQEDPLGKYYYQNIYPDEKDGKVEPEPVQFTKRWEDTNIVARGYNWEQAGKFNSPDSGPREKLEKVFREFMKERMGVPDYELLQPTECAPIVDKYWPTYFPHVSIEEFQAGFYDKFELLQGENNFYYTSSALAFESMEQTVAYSELLIKKYF